MGGLAKKLAAAAWTEDVREIQQARDGREEKKMLPANNPSFCKM